MTRWACRLGGRVHQGVPLSAEAVRRFERDVQAARTVAGQRDALARLLRLCFPLRWRNLWDGDPVRQILASPERDQLVLDLLKLPDETPEATRPPDDWDALEAAQRVPTLPDPHAPTITLDLVCRLVELHWGADWYYAPASGRWWWHKPSRWPTRDGYAPYDEVWRAWRTLQQERALLRLNLIRAIAVTKAGERAQTFIDADVREALRG